MQIQLSAQSRQDGTMEENIRPGWHVSCSYHEATPPNHRFSVVARREEPSLTIDVLPLLEKIVTSGLRKLGDVCRSIICSVILLL